MPGDSSVLRQAPSPNILVSSFTSFTGCVCAGRPRGTALIEARSPVDTRFHLADQVASFARTLARGSAKYLRTAGFALTSTDAVAADIRMPARVRGGGVYLRVRRQAPPAPGSLGLDLG